MIKKDMEVVLLLQILNLLSEKSFEKDLKDLTHEIVHAHFKSFKCITYITSDLESSWPINTSIPVINIDLTDDYSQDTAIDFSFFEGCGGYIIRSHPEKKRDIILSLINSYTNTSNHKYNNQRYFYLPYDERDDEVSVLNSDEMFYTPNLIMVTALDYEEQFNFSLWSHNWFHGHKYDNMKIKYEIMDYWTSQKRFHRVIDDIYFDRLENVHGKLIMLGLLHYPVYAVVVKEGNETIYDGMETRLAAMYVEKINGTWDGVDHPDYFWGNVYPDGRSDGIVGSVLSHRVEMGFAALYPTVFCDYTACSYPYAYPEITCMVPRPKKSPGWMTVVLSFTPLTWAALFTAYLTSSIMVFFATSVRKNKMTYKIRPLFSAKLLFEGFFLNFRLQIEQIPKVAKEKSSVGIFLKFLNVYYFFVANCWIGGIASILTVPRFERGINTMSDMIENYPTVKWGADAIAWVESMDDSEKPDLKFIADNFVVLDHATLREKTKTGDFSFFMERLPNGHFGMNDYIDEESLQYLKLMEGYIYHDSTVFILPKGSPYQEKFDKLIFKLFDMGIVIKLETQAALDRVNTRFQNLILTSTRKLVEEQTSLQISHLEGPIFIYVGGMCFSSLVFVLELFYSKLK